MDEVIQDNCSFQREDANLSRAISELFKFSRYFNPDCSAKCFQIETRFVLSIPIPEPVYRSLKYARRSI